MQQYIAKVADYWKITNILPERAEQYSSLPILLGCQVCLRSMNLLAGIGHEFRCVSQKYTPRLSDTPAKNWKQTFVCFLPLSYGSLHMWLSVICWCLFHHRVHGEIQVPPWKKGQARLAIREHITTSRWTQIQHTEHQTTWNNLSTLYRYYLMYVQLWSTLFLIIK